MTELSTVTTLGEFIVLEMERHGWSSYDLAKLCDVTHNTVLRHMNYGLSDTYGGRKISEPSVKFLRALAKATSTDICIIISLIAPEVSFGINPNTIALSELINRMPAADQEIVNNFIRGRAKPQQQGD